MSDTSPMRRSVNSLNKRQIYTQIYKHMNERLCTHKSNLMLNPTTKKEANLSNMIFLNQLTYFLLQRVEYLERPLTTSGSENNLVIPINGTEKGHII